MKSNQNFGCIAQNHNLHLMLLGLTNYADVTSLRTLKPVDEKLKKKKRKPR